MSAIVNDRDVLLQAAGTRLSTTTMPSNWTTQWTQVIGVGRPDDNADVTLSELNGGLAVTGGGITLDGGGSIKGGQTAYATGTGFFLGWVAGSPGSYRFSIGDSTTYLRWSGSGLALAGSVTCTLTGTATFEGTTVQGARNFTVVVNDNAANPYGIYVEGTSGNALEALATAGSAVYGYASGSGGIGLRGEATGSGGFGGAFSATHSAGIGLVTTNSTGTSIAFQITNGTFKWASQTWAEPDGSTTKYFRADGSWTNLTYVSLYEGTSSTASAGAATLPANPSGFLLLNTLGGAGQVKVPYYAA